MEFKGTKGEWEVKHSHSKTAYNIVGTVLGGKYKIARCPYETERVCIDSLNEKQEAKANAQLIATAPEMLEVLLKVQKAINQMDYSEIEGLYNEVEESINKALGKEIEK